MQFYNSEISKALEELSDRGFDLRLELTKYSQTAINSSLSSGEVISIVDFQKGAFDLLSDKLDEFTDRVNELPKVLNQRNIEELDSVMETQGISKVRLFADVAIDQNVIDDFKKVVNTIINEFYNSYLRSYNGIQSTVVRTTTSST